MATLTNADPAARLQALKAQVEAAKTQRIQAEARMEQLSQARDTILADLTALGVTPETLDSTIADLEATRDRLIAEVEALLQGAV